MSEPIQWAVPKLSRLLKELYDENCMEVLAKQVTPKYSEVYIHQKVQNTVNLNICNQIISPST